MASSPWAIFFAATVAQSLTPASAAGPGTLHPATASQWPALACKDKVGPTWPDSAWKPTLDASSPGPSKAAPPRAPHIPRMALIVVQAVSARPVDVGLLGPQTVMLRPHVLVHAVQELGLTSCRWHLWRIGNAGINPSIFRFA